MRKLAITMLAIPIIASCASVEMIEDAPQAVSTGACQVRVFQTRAQAEKRGKIEELCIINGTSSGSFSHTVATAIDKHKSKACGCGANNVYVESRTQSGLDVATVTMVAFRFAE